MSGVDSTDRAMPLSRVVRAAAQGVLPDWSRVTAGRREHIGRVAALMDEWARALSLSDEDHTRWVATGWLHDSLRDAHEAELRDILGDLYADFPPPLLHGPAAAHLLQEEADEAMLMAIRYHTLGHPRLDRLGRALYLADFLEPGRPFAKEWRGSLRDRMPQEMDGVLQDVVAARIRNLLDERRPLRPETAAFWSALVNGGQ